MKTYRIRYKNSNGVLVTTYINAANAQHARGLAGVSGIVEIREW